MDGLFFANSTMLIKTGMKMSRTFDSSRRIDEAQIKPGGKLVVGK